MENKKTVAIISVTSDIGTALAEKYSEKGDIIIGTYRSKEKLEELTKIKNCYLFPCDISDKESVKNLAEEFKKNNFEWDKFISCTGDILPLSPFFDGNFEEWNNSVHVNAIEQLRILHELYPFRNKNKISDVIYFAGGGMNKPGVNLSAYTASKIFLIKMCEILDAENKDINSFIIGPGWVKTKIHQKVLENLNSNDEKYKETKRFLDNEGGTKMEDIFNCIEWLCEQGKKIVGGKNFSVIYDKWGTKELSETLQKDRDFYKLRRNEQINDK
jgi:short-subunit dehydrogenase